MYLCLLQPSFVITTQALLLPRHTVFCFCHSKHSLCLSLVSACTPVNHEISDRTTNAILFSCTSVRLCDIRFVRALLWKRAGGPLKACLFQETCYTGCHCPYCSRMHSSVLTPAALALQIQCVMPPISQTAIVESKCPTIFYIG